MDFLQMKSLLLFSGGIDSTALAYWKRPDLLLFVDYGQKNVASEEKASEAISKMISIPLEKVRIHLNELGSGTLSNGGILSGLSPNQAWWPFRNQFLITIAAAFAVKGSFGEVMIATVSNDWEYKDGSVGFIETISKLLLLQEGGIRLSAPAIEMTAVELTLKAQVPPEVLSKTFSCTSTARACGVCASCLKRYEVLKSTGLVGE
jgi:7-cyano-7-deazaguanine synthase